MKRQIGTPAKVVTALVNVGFIVAALALPQVPLLTVLAIAVWSIHSLMALASLGIAPRKGKPRSVALEVLFVGTLSLMQLVRS